MQHTIATVGGVYSDGLSLIFPGETTPSGKHYKCNTSVTFRAGDRVKVFYDSGTYIVEYVIGATGAASGSGTPTETPSTGVDLTTVFNRVYPVGCYYWSSSATSPEYLFGGTWERVKDKFILAAGNSYLNGSIGGEATHTLSVEEMPIHTHDLRTGSKTGYIYPRYGSVYKGDGSNGTQNILLAYNSETNGQYGLIAENSGAGLAHNNMPPYIVAFCWHRTA